MPTINHFWIEIIGIKGAKLPKSFWCCGRCGERSDQKQKVWDGGKKLVEKGNQESKETTQNSPEVGEEGRKIPPLGALSPPNWTGKGFSGPFKAADEIGQERSADRWKGDGNYWLEEGKNDESGSQIYKEPEYEAQKKEQIKLLKQVLVMSYLCIAIAIFAIIVGITVGEYKLILPGPVFMLGAGIFVRYFIKGKLKCLGS